MTTTSVPARTSASEDRYRAAERACRTLARDVRELELPSTLVVAVDGNEPPGSDQFRAAISALYSVGYTLKMGLKFNKLPRPDGYFDYGVGPLHALWWSTTGTVQIDDPATLRWRAFLVVPEFVTPALLDEAERQSKDRHPEVDTGAVTLVPLNEGRCVQALHVGPYDAEQPLIDRLHDYVRKHGLEMAGPQHEIYVSDPNRTASQRLKTVIRYPVRPSE